MDARVAADLRAALDRLGVADPDVGIERVASIDRGPTGKAPLISTIRDDRGGAAPPGARS